WLERKADDGVRPWMEAMNLGNFLFTITLHERGQLSLSLRRTSALFYAAQQVIIVAAATSRIGRIESHGRPDLPRFLLTRWKLKAFRHDADDDALQAVEVGLAADDVGITRKGALPSAIGNVCHDLSSRRIVGWRNHPTGKR